MPVKTEIDLRRARLIAGYSQAQLAARIGVTQQSVLRWENGTSKLRASNAARLAGLLNLDIEELIDGGLVLS